MDFGKRFRVADFRYGQYNDRNIQSDAFSAGRLRFCNFSRAFRGIFRNFFLGPLSPAFPLNASGGRPPALTVGSTVPVPASAGTRAVLPGRLLSRHAHPGAGRVGHPCRRAPAAYGLPAQVQEGPPQGLSVRLPPSRRRHAPSSMEALRPSGEKLRAAFRGAPLYGGSSS